MPPFVALLAMLVLVALAVVAFAFALRELLRAHGRGDVHLAEKIAAWWRSRTGRPQRRRTLLAGAPAAVVLVLAGLLGCLGVARAEPAKVSAKDTRAALLRPQVAAQPAPVLPPAPLPLIPTTPADCAPLPPSKADELARGLQIASFVITGVLGAVATGIGAWYGGAQIAAR